MKERSSQSAGVTTIAYALLFFGVLVTVLSFIAGIQFVGDFVESFLPSFVPVDSLFWIGLATMALAFFLMMGPEDDVEKGE